MSTPITETEGTGRRAGLDRDEIVERALDLVEREGADALTMRRLAADLDVTTTTIYWHVGSRADLVTAIIRRQSERHAAHAVVGDTPDERVMSIAHAVWQSAVDHRNVTSLAHQVGATSLLGFPLEQALARELNAAGLDGTDVRDAVRGILMCVAGFLVVALRRDESTPAEHRSSSLWSELEDPMISSSTAQALSTPVDVEALFDTTIGAVVASFLPHGETTA